MNYFPWLEDDEDSSLAWLNYVPNALRDLPEEFELHRGIPVQRWFPRDVTFPMAQDRGIELADSLPNALNLIFVSERMKGFLQERSGARIEFLPIRVKDQKKRLVPGPYYIMNLLDMVECVDLEKSKFRRSSIEPEFIFHVYQLVLDESRIPNDAKLFRLKEKPDLFIVRQDLAQELIDAGFKGMMFQDLEELGKEWGER